MLVASLAAVFLAFCIIMGAVLMFCIRQRRHVDGLEPDKNMPVTAAAVATKDSVIVKVLFGAIIAGALLALITGYLVFFRVWE